MGAHNEWIQRGLDEGVFLLVGNLQPNLGGAILARRSTRAELEARLSADPFVSQGVVDVELFEIAPSRTDERLAFLLE
jgi:uncharacterized protein YciI